ncbi:hypothetical protein HNY73_006273 [Argiope bruennichi]|nr:hypothetical protein HNY73_006273 [Argiope bruennichi]
MTTQLLDIMELLKLTIEFFRDITSLECDSTFRTVKNCKECNRWQGLGQQTSFDFYPQHTEMIPMPCRDDPYIILSQRSPTTFEVANPDVLFGVYHTSALLPHQDPSFMPLSPLCKSSRPKKILLAPSPRWRQGQRGRL